MLPDLAIKKVLGSKIPYKAVTFWAILKNVNVWVNIAVTTSWQIEVKIEDTFYSKLWSHWIRVGVSKALGTYLFRSQWMSGKRLAKLYLAVNVGWVSSRGVPTDYHIHNSPSVCFSTDCLATAIRMEMTRTWTMFTHMISFRLNWNFVFCVYLIKYFSLYHHLS